jgi:hypothetical protein
MSDPNSDAYRLGYTDPYSSPPSGGTSMDHYNYLQGQAARQNQDAALKGALVGNSAPNSTNSAGAYSPPSYSGGGSSGGGSGSFLGGLIKGLFFLFIAYAIFHAVT